MNAIIHTDRLDLIPMTLAVLRLVLAGDFRGAGELLGVSAPAGWAISRDALELRLSQIEANPGLQPWLLRAISLRGQGILAGHIGFHTEPGAEYLAELSPGGVEFGFGLLGPWRRRGIALERIFLPSRPIIFPLISSLSILKMDTQFSMACSVAVR